MTNDEILARLRLSSVPVEVTEAVEGLIAKVEELKTPNYYWDDEDLEYARGSIADAVEGCYAGQVVTLRPLHELPKIHVLVGETGHQVLDNQEAAEAAKDNH